MTAILLITASFVVIAAAAGMVPPTAAGDAILGGVAVTIAVCGIAFTTLALKAQKERNVECVQSSSASCSR